MSNTMNTSNITNTTVKEVVHGRPRSKSVGEGDVDPEFVKMLASKRVDAFEDVSTGYSVSAEVPLYEDTPNVADAIFENFVNNLIEIVPSGTTIMGGTAHVLMSKKFGIKPLNFLTDTIATKSDGTVETFVFKRDIDIILPSLIKFESILRHLEQFGQVDVVKTAQTYSGIQTHHNLRQMRRLVIVKLTIPLREKSIRMLKRSPIGLFGQFLSKELLMKFPESLVIDMDFVEIVMSDVSELANHWFVTNEIRSYALMIKQKRGSMFSTSSGDSERELVPVRIASILPPAMTNMDGNVIVPLNTIFDYVKGMMWETSPIPGRTRSGMMFPPGTTEPLKITSELDVIVRLANIHSDRAVAHVAMPDLWIPHIVYDETVTVDTIRETFPFGKLDKDLSGDDLEKFRDDSARRVFEHIHTPDMGCSICFNSLIIPGTSFVAFPCGCTSVMHLECFVQNYLSNVILQVMNSPTGRPEKGISSCIMCRKPWWTVKKPRNQIQFRALRNEYSKYFTVEEVIHGTMFQLYNIKLYEQLNSNPKATDFWDFVE